MRILLCACRAYVCWCVRSTPSTHLHRVIRLPPIRVDLWRLPRPDFSRRRGVPLAGRGGHVCCPAGRHVRRHAAADQGGACEDQVVATNDDTWQAMGETTVRLRAWSLIAALLAFTIVSRVAEPL